MTDPFFILAACLAAGIAIASTIAGPFVIWGVSSLFLFLGFLILSLRRSGLAWPSLCLLFVAAGGFLFRTSNITPQIFQEEAPPILAGIAGRVVDVPETAFDGTKTYGLDRVRFWTDSQTIRLRGKISLQSAKSLGAGPGDVIAMRGPSLRFSPLVRPRNPGSWNGEEFARNRGICGRVFARQDARVEILSRGRRSAWEGLLDKIRRRWGAALEMPSDAAGQGQATSVLKGMILGERVAIDPSVRESFLRTNTFHILAISGQQMTLIFLILFGMLRAVGISTRTTALFSIPTVLLYAAAVGWQPSVARSAIMIVLVLVGLAFDRKVRILRMLGIAALVLLLRNPHELFDVGFQLSFLAVLFLVIFTAPILAWMRGRMGGSSPWEDPAAPVWKKFCARGVFPLLSASFAAWLATAPITAWYFLWFSPITLLANLLIVGWVSALTIPLGFASVLLGSAWIPLSYPINAVNAKLTGVLIKLADCLAAVPGGSLMVSRPSAWALLWYFAFFAVLAFGLGRLGTSQGLDRPVLAIPNQRRRWKWTLGILAALAVVSQVMFLHRLECVFFDVGQGDAIFVRFPNGKGMLVDAGPGGHGRPFDKALMAYLRSLGIHKIDHLVMTHPHADHIGGAPAIMEKVPVGELLGNGRAFPSLVYRRLLRVAEHRSIPLRFAQGPRAWLNEGDASVRILFPGAQANAALIVADKKDGNENDHSIVLNLTYGGKSILLAGDIERKAEDYLATHCPNLQADVLKVPHHGGNTSSSEKFLDKVRGRWAVISVGRRNRFGHPTAEVLQRLSKKGWKIFRTDQDGAVVIRAYGPWWTLKTIASSRYAWLW